MFIPSIKANSCADGEFRINNVKKGLCEMRLTNRIKELEQLDTFYFGFSEFRFRFCFLSFCSEVAHKGAATSDYFGDESDTDKKLTKLAKSVINVAAK